MILNFAHFLNDYTCQKSTIVKFIDTFSKFHSVLHNPMRQNWTTNIVALSPQSTTAGLELFLCAVVSHCKSIQTNTGTWRTAGITFEAWCNAPAVDKPRKCKFWLPGFSSICCKRVTDVHAVGPKKGKVRPRSWRTATVEKRLRLLHFFARVVQVLIQARTTVVTKTLLHSSTLLMKDYANVYRNDVCGRFRLHKQNL